MINFKRPGDIDSSVVPSLGFDQHEQVFIYIDHIAVAYFDEGAGGLRPVYFEIDQTGSGDVRDLGYLIDRGFKFDIVHNANSSIFTLKMGKSYD